MPLTKGIKAAVIEMGRVLDVDIDTYSLAITTQFSRKPITGVSFATGYQHFYGEGIYFMPEVGSLCWVCFPSDSNKAFVLAWAPPNNEGDYRANKKDLNPGDIYLGTRDDNFLILRRGGVVQIGGGPLSQRVFLPINNMIKDFCENYSLHSLGGDLEWSIGREESTTDGKRPAIFKLHAREFANDSKPVASLEIGSHDGNEQRILSLKIKASGQESADTVIELNGNKDGKLDLTVVNTLTVYVKENITVEGDKDILLKAKQALNLQGESVEIKGGTGGVSIESSAMVTIKGSPLVKIDSKTQAGGIEPVAKAPALLLWLATHVHLSSVPGSPTTPPVVPPPGSIASSTLFSG